jgi:dipeptidyl aminopeptidase/acylaminoacyl peptidase
LTEYVIGNYDVTGKVYLFGLSMGGCIALLLGAKYPNLYDGVLEAAGTKDAVSMYTLKMNYANIADDDDLEAAILANGGLVPPSPFTTVGEFRDYCLTAGNDLALACGGTPEKKPKAYERISPTFSAVDIEVPTITVHGDADALVPYADSLEYFTAVTQAGHSDLYRLYKVSGAQHIDPLLTIQMGMSFFYLVTWVEYGIPPPPSNT